MSRVYPLLLAAAPVLYLADGNPGGFALDDLLMVVAALLLLTGLVQALAAAVLRGRADGYLAPAVAGLFVLGFYGFPPLAAQVPRGPMYLPLLVLAVAVAAGSVLLLRWAARRPRHLCTAATFLALTGALLVGRFGAGIALDRARAAEAVERSRIARTLAAPIPGPRQAPGPVRDVYVIVLDEYANAEILREVLGFDNRPFVDSLRALGFHVPRSVGSNYAHTILSLPSLLSASHLARLEGELPEGSTDPTLVNHLLERGRVPRYLRERGYRFVFYPSGWWLSTRENSLADSTVGLTSGLDLHRELARSDLRRAIRRSTLLDYVHRDAGPDRAAVRGTLDRIARLPKLGEPVFAFAHLLSPHSPYVFDAACGMPPRYRAGRTRSEGYLAQLQCLNGMVLATVGRLLRDSEVPPVIIIQGDHGTAIRKYSDAPSAAAVSAAAARERFGAFGAYYLPGGGEAAFGDTVTVVNVLGNVLRHYFGADLPPEPDAQYLSLEDSPFDFVRVDPDWLAGRDSGTRAHHRAEARR